MSRPEVTRHPSTAIRRKLSAAADSTSLVRIERSPRHADRLYGFVVGIGNKWVLVAKTMDGGYFDGYAAIRLRDVRRVTRDRSFASAFARTQPEWPPTPPPGGIDLDSTKGMLRTLGATAPLLGIEKERERSATWIGTFVGLSHGAVGLHEVHPDASWYEQPLWYERRAVTMASVGTHYLTGRTAVAGTRARP